MSFLVELKRRNVLRVAAAYLVAAWLLIQVVETLFPLYGLSDSAIRLVVTLLVIGFILAVVLAWAFELTPEGLMRDKDVDRSLSIAPQTGKKLDRIIMVVMVLALGYFALDKFVIDPQRDAEEIQVATEEAVEQAIAEAEDALPDASIAVLPFENFSGKEEDEYFSDGLADTVLHQLAQVSDLKVIARNSTFQFKGKNLDVRDIGERLGVANVLEGSVQRYGDQVRVIAQLIRTSDGVHVWSQSFDYKMEDIFALHDAIALAVVTQMKLALLPEDRLAISLGGTDVPEAYDLLLQAWGSVLVGFLPMVAETVDPDDGFMPMTILDKALALDPDYVDALVSKARIYNMFAFQTTSFQRTREFIGRAKPIVARLMELAPDYSEAWTAKGGLEHRSGDINEAIESLARAIELNPNDAMAHQGIAIAYGTVDPLKTIEHMRIARELDPENPFNRPTVLALAKLGRIDEAISALESSLTGGSGLDQMILDDLSEVTRLALGRPDISARWSGELLKLRPGSIRGVANVTEAWLAVGDIERAERWITTIEGTGGDSFFLKATRAKLSIAKGDMAAAMAAVDSMGRPQGPAAALVLQLKSLLCIAQTDLDCARTAAEAFEKALDMADARGFSLPEWRRQLHLLSATIAARSGESANVPAQQVVDSTRGEPRSGWVGNGIYYQDVEAFVLLGKHELALQALEEALLPDGGFLPRDSFMTPADRGVVLSDLDGVPGFEDWKTRFRTRRDAMREKMLAMEAAGEIPAPREEPK